MTEAVTEAAPSPTQAVNGAAAHPPPEATGEPERAEVAAEAAAASSAEEKKPREPKFEVAYRKLKEERKALARAKQMEAQVAQREAALAEQVARLQESQKAIEDREKQFRSLYEQNASAQDYEKAGFDPSRIAHAIVNDGKLPPEKQIEILAERNRSLEDKLEKFIDSLNKEKQEALAAHERSRIEAQTQSATSGYANYLKDHKTEYPHLYRVYGPQRGAERAWNAAVDYAKQQPPGWKPPEDFDAFIASALDEEAKGVYDEWLEREKEFSAPQARPDPTRQNGSTLTNQLASESAAAPKEPSREERRKLAAKRLRLPGD